MYLEISSGSKLRNAWNWILRSKRVVFVWCHATLVFIYKGSHCHSATTGIAFGMFRCAWLTQVAAVNADPIRQPWFEKYASSELLLTAGPLRFLYIRFFVVFFAFRNGRTRIAILSAVRKKISRPGDSTKIFLNF